MQLTFDIPEKDLVEFGKATIQEEIQKMLKWLKIRKSFRKISEALQGIDAEFYHRQLEEIRETTWNEYKRDLPL